MNRKDWRTVSKKDIGSETNEIRNELLPLLRAEEMKEALDTEKWVNRLAEEIEEKTLRA